MFGAIHKPRGQTRGGAQKATTPIIKIIGGGWGSPPFCPRSSKIGVFHVLIDSQKIPDTLRFMCASIIYIQSCLNGEEKKIL